MKKIFMTFSIALLLTAIITSNAQTVRKLTLDEVVRLAEEQSPNALIAKNRFRSSYWQYRSFVAEYRPSLTLEGTTPDYSNAYTRVFTGGNFDYVPTNILQTIGSLGLSQNIGLTGGSISLRSDFTFQRDFEAVLGRTPTGEEIRGVVDKYITVPTYLRVVQPILRYNQLKWQRKTEPLRYEAARKSFLANIEEVHRMAVMNFFSLALAQINKQISDMNYSNADTLYKIAQGRYDLGTISEDELLQMKLSWLNTETNRKQAEMNLRDREIRLRSFLGFNNQIRLELDLPTEIPSLQVSAQQVYDLAMANNPEIISQHLAVLQAQSTLAQAKADRGLNANIIANFGLQGKDEDFNVAYSELSRNQGVRLNFTLPILDWGLGKGRYLMAKYNLDLAQVQSNQAITDFEQNLYLDVEQFNLQAEQVRTAATSDTVAMRRYEVTKQRFLIGKIDVLDLNDADARKDENKRAYVQQLQNYWNYFYNLRALTLYDFVKNQPIETDYEKLLD